MKSETATMNSTPQAHVFLETLAKSQLLSERIIAQMRQKLPNHPELNQSATHFARYLFQHHLLTRWQCQRLLRGEYHDFYFGKYRILEPLGGGGMGRLFLAEHLTMHRLIVLKLLHESLTQDAASQARFLREARALAALRHPNIIQAFDHDRFRNRPFLVMEFAEGLNLQEVVGQHGRLPYALAAEYVAQAAAGLQHAHERRLVHRDIKPGNLLLDLHGIVKILDLGLASFFEKRHANSVTTNLDSEVLGTADYLAPEQAVDFHNVDIRGDIYSLGAVFYFLLSGRPPFAGGTYAQKLLQHQMNDPKPLQELGVVLPAPLEQLLRRMMAKDKAHRFQTPAEVVQQLQPFRQNGSVPFAPGELKFRSLELEKFLGKGPAKLNHLVAEDTVTTGAGQTEPIPTRGVLTAPLPLEPTEALPTAARVTKPTSAAAADSNTTRQPLQTAALPASPRLSQPERRRPSRRPRPQQPWLWLAVLGISLVLLTLGGVIVTLIWTRPQTPLLVQTVLDEDRPILPQYQPIAGARPIKPETFKRWAVYREQIKFHRNLIVYYSMHQPITNSIVNHAVASQGRFAGLLGDAQQADSKPQVVPGRWPEKFGLAFNRPDAVQHLMVENSHREVLVPGESFSVAVWCQFTATTNTYPTLISKGNTAWRLQVSGPHQLAEFVVGSPSKDFRALLGRENVVDGAWHLLIGTYITAKDNQGQPEMRLYVDGKLEQSRLRFTLPDSTAIGESAYEPSKLLATVPSNEQPIFIGNNSQKLANARCFLGVIDEVLIFHGALIDEEVQKLYRAGNPYE